MHVISIVFQAIEMYTITKCILQGFSTNSCSVSNLPHAADGNKFALNTTIRPCDNFYDYACHKWRTIYESKGASENFLESLTMLDHRVNVEMSYVLQKFTMENKPKFINETQKYYTSCKNLKEDNPNEYLHWLELHDQFNWPYRKANSTKLDWVNMLGKMRTYGLNDVFIKLNFACKVNNVNEFLISLAMPSMDEDFVYLTEKDVDSLMELMPELKGFDKEWPAINEFEKRLKQLKYTKDVEKKRLVKFKDLPLQWLQQYLQIVLNQTIISPDMEFFIRDKSYIMALDELLSDCSQHFLNKYLMIRFLQYLMSIPPNDFNAIDCVHSTRSLMATAMHWLYEEQHPDLRQEFANISEIFNKIRHQFGKTIQKNKYNFNATIVQHLQSKLDHMKLRLNNLPRVNTVATLERFYHGLDLNPNDFYGNHLKLLKFCFNADLVLLDKKKTILDFTYLADTDTEINSSAYFMHKANTIVVPLTLLQLPYYQANFTNIFKYSSVGFFLAHEMFHAFDDTGLLINANGTESFINFKENPLYNASFNCLLKVNGVSINEKIADISGLYYAYHALFDNDATLRHEDYHEFFFMNFAQFFCGATTSASHGSGSDRVMDAVAQLPKFAKIFRCSSNDRLYSNETCNLWH